MEMGESFAFDVEVGVKATSKVSTFSIMLSLVVKVKCSLTLLEIQYFELSFRILFFKDDLFVLLVRDSPS